MLIVAGHLLVDTARRDDYVAAHADLVARGRLAEDCLDLVVAADTVDPQRVNLFERWANEESLDAWRAIADPPQLDVSYLGGDVQKYSIDAVSPAFGS